MLFTNTLVLLASASLTVALPGNGWSTTTKPAPPPSYETTCSAVYSTKTELCSSTKTWATTEYTTKPTTYLKTLTYTDVVTKPVTSTGYVTKVRSTAF